MLTSNFASQLSSKIYSFAGMIAVPLFQSILIVIVGLIAAPILQKVIASLIKRFKVEEKLHPVILLATKYSIYLIAGTYVLTIITGVISQTNSIWFASTGFMIVKAIAIAIAGIITISYADKLVKKALNASKIDPILHTFICSAFKVVALAVVGISAIDALGVPTTSLIAAISAIGLAVSLGVKDNISNLFAGVVVIVTKPFVSGDFIEMDGYSGKVTEIGLIYTTLYTFDNKKVFIPNNDAAKAKITNHSAEPIRRLDLTFTVGYKDSIETAKKIIADVAKKSGLMLEEHPTVIGVTAQGAHGIDIATKIWVNWPDYYALQFYMLEEIKKAFDKEGIQIPYNQLDVHIINPIVKS